MKKTPLRLAFLFVAAALCIPNPAMAGVAVVQAVEQGGGVCAAANAAEAFECAKQQCEAGGAAREDCLEMSYCLSGWTVDVFMQSKEGPHWHEYYCGWQQKEIAVEAGRLACNAERMKDLMECSAVGLIGEDGKSIEIAPEEAQ